MAKDQFLTYQRFINKDEAQLLSELLAQHGIEFELEDASPSVNPLFANHDHEKEYRVKLRKEDFARADNSQNEASQSLIEDVSEDYYLFQFSDEELVEIISKSDEWSNFDYLLSQRILKDRGKEVSPELLKVLKKHRVDELAKPEERQTSWIIAGYFFAIMGGLLGIFIGWYLRSHIKTLPNGDRVYAYSEEDRKSGKRIFIIGLIFLPLSPIIRAYIYTM